MDLTKRQKFEITKKLAQRIYDMGEIDGFHFLNIYKGDKDSLYYENDRGNEWHIGFTHQSILEFLSNVRNEIIYEMYIDQFPAEDVEKLLNKKLAYKLSTKKLVLFFSHSHKDLDLIRSIKQILEKTNWIECFVAHKDIKLSKEWEQEIQKHLNCCDCLIAFLSKNFKSSDYCDQEVGVAINRQIPICQFTLDDTKSYGFIKYLQAKPFKKPEKLANLIEEYILDKEETLYQIAQPKLYKVVENIKNIYLSSPSTIIAENALDQLIEFKSGQIDNYFIHEIKEYWEKNNHIKKVKNIDEKMKKLFEKHPIKMSKSEILKKSAVTIKKEKVNERTDIPF